MTTIQIHLNLQGHQTSSGEIIESCLTSALRDARKISGQNATSGQPDTADQCGHLGIWAGAMCYMTILDQIGKCYRPTAKTQIHNGPAIQKALKYFTGLTDAEINAVYALRNAFFHDFSLNNRNGADPSLQHIFTVDTHPPNPFVVLPVAQWDGLMTSRTAATTTYINLNALGDLPEKIYQDLLTLEAARNLSLDLPNGNSELLDRYTFANF